MKTVITDIELFTEDGTDFKLAQNTFNIKLQRLPFALGLYFWLESLDNIELFSQPNLRTLAAQYDCAILCFAPYENEPFSLNSSL